MLISRIARTLAGVVLVCASVLPLRAWAQQNITGQVTGEGNPLAGAYVYILDASNALIVATSTTDGTGSYDSGSLPTGTYKVRFAAVNCDAQYFGAPPKSAADYFDLGTPVTVMTGSTAVVSADLEYSLPAPILPPCGSQGLTGYVTDAVSGTAIANVNVSVVSAVNAMPFGSAVTDAIGLYVWVPGKEAPDWTCGTTVKVRFSDPAAIYLPVYSGASGQDVFELGAPVELLEDLQVTVSEKLAKLTPVSAIDNFANEITNSSLPSATTASMTELLSRAKEILSDNNPNNDAAACGILKALVNRINAKQHSGELSAFEAEILTQAADTARNAIGCR